MASCRVSVSAIPDQFPTYDSDIIVSKWSSANSTVRVVSNEIPRPTTPLSIMDAVRFNTVSIDMKRPSQSLTVVRMLGMGTVPTEPES